VKGEEEGEEEEAEADVVASDRGRVYNQMVSCEKPIVEAAIYVGIRT